MKVFNTDEEGIGPLELGRKRYQEKDYKGAVEAFTEGVNQSTGHILLTALDHRAAAYEKLGLLQLALWDSKKMIDEKPERAKGYLRCGKVLHLKGEKDLALKIYERGLTKVKHGTDTERLLLQSMANKSCRAQDPGKSLDPLQYLPLELAAMVVQNLEMRDRIICLRVSKPWKRLLESSHSLWTTLDTSSTRKPLSQHALKVYLRRSNYTLESATINYKAQFDEKKWAYLTKSCKNLNRLKINGAGIIGHSLMNALPTASNLTSIAVSANCEINQSAVERVFHCCQKTLVHATFLAVTGPRTLGHWPILPALQSLDLRCKKGVTTAMPTNFSDGVPIPNIKSLTLAGGSIGPVMIDLSLCNSLESLGIIDIDIRQFPIIPSTIRHMNFNQTAWLQTISDATATLDRDYPVLEAFSCEFSSLNGNDVKELTANSIKAGNLKKLCVGGRLDESLDRPVADEYPASNTIEELSLAGLPLREQRVIEIVDLYPSVRTLDVSYTKVTGVAVKRFVSMGVKWLKLNECTEISPDAVEYARGKGVEVEFNFPSRSRTATGYGDRLSSAF